VAGSGRTTRMGVQQTRLEERAGPVGTAFVKVRQGEMIKAPSDLPGTATTLLSKGEVG